MNVGGPLFQASLVKVASAYPGDWTPAEYALDYYMACVSEGKPANGMDVGRCLRNLPSFLREYLLADAIGDAGYEVELPAPEVNALAHIDLLLKVDGREVTVWSYLNTDKAIGMLKRKISSRGNIRPGFNLLAPISRKGETESYLKWYVPTNGYVEALVAAARSHPLEAVEDMRRLQGIDYTTFQLVNHTG